MRARTHLMGAIGVRAPRHQQASLPGLITKSVPCGAGGPMRWGVGSAWSWSPGVWGEWAGISERQAYGRRIV